MASQRSRASGTERETLFASGQPGARFYPIFLDLHGRRCVVVGGGAVAERRIEGLLAAGAAVTVISPGLTDRLKQWASAGVLRHAERRYEPGDLAGCDIVFAAAGAGAVNQAVAAEAHARGIWVNAADDPPHCDFILPATVQRGGLSVAISTGGRSPAATRVVREELEAYLTADYAALVEIAREVRRELKEKSAVVSAGRWNDALKGKCRRLLKAGRVKRAKTVLLGSLEGES